MIILLMYKILYIKYLYIVLESWALREILISNHSSFIILLYIFQTIPLFLNSS